jgi:hypothetical protein
VRRRWAALGIVVVAACHSFDSTDPSKSEDGGAPNDAGVTAPNDAQATGPNDAGPCGHSCLGGACTNGVCQPALVQTFTGLPGKAIVVSKTQIAWLEETLYMGTVLANCPVDSPCGTGDVMRVAATDNPMGLTVVGDSIFASAGGNTPTIWRIDATGNLSELALGANPPFTRPFALTRIGDDSGIYVLVVSNIDKNGIYRIGFDAAVTRIAQLASNDDGHNNILALADRVFILDYNAGIGSIPQDNTPDKPVQPWCNGCTHINDFGTDGKTLYWATNDSQVVGCLGAASCVTPIPVSDSLAFPEVPRWVEAPGADVLITTNPGTDNRAKIYRCPANNCRKQLTPLVTEPAFAAKPFTTADNVTYWIADDGPAADAGLNVHNLRIMRLAQ